MSITPQVFAQTCRNLIGRPSHVALAVSGGVDSMSLAYLAREALSDTHLTALTIDHGAREGSDKEARHVQQNLQKLGIDDCRILEIEDMANGKRFELEARKNRARLFHRACNDIRRQGRDLNHLMLAHTLNDQLETFFMRLIMGSSPTGLSGIRPVNRSPVLAPPDETPVTFARPLLDVSKQELYALCKSHQIPWVEDATNHDPHFTARNAIRHLIATNKLPEGLDVEKVHAYIEYLQNERLLHESKSNLVIQKLVGDGSVLFDDVLGVLKIDRAAYEAVDDSIKGLTLLKLTEPIIPVENHYYKLSDFQKLATTVNSAAVASTSTVSNLQVECSSATITITRQRPYSKQVDGLETSIELSPSNEWSSWQLFDKRIWVRARSTRYHSISIRYSSDPAATKTLLNKESNGETVPKIPFKLLQILPIVCSSDGALLGHLPLGPFRDLDIEYSYKQSECWSTH